MLVLKHGVPSYLKIAERTNCVIRLHREMFQQDKTTQKDFIKRIYATDHTYYSPPGSKLETLPVRIAH